MPESGPGFTDATSITAAAVDRPVVSCLDVPSGALPDPAQSALNTAASQQDVEQQPGNVPLDDGGTVTADVGLMDGVPVDSATVDGAEGAEGAQAKKKKSEPRIMVPFTSEELDEIIKQGFTLIEKECQKKEYDNGKVEVWKTLLEDYLVRCTSSLSTPFKYTFYVSLHQNCGDAINVALGGFFQADFDGYTTGHWENDDLQVDVIIMAFSVQ